MARLAMHVVRILGIVVLTSCAVALATAAVAAAAPPQVATAPPCDCTPSDAGGGDAKPVSTVTTPSVGAGDVLRVTVPLVAGGVALIGSSVLLRPRRRS